MAADLKIVFWGTPEEAVPFLELCARDHQVLAVVTRSDKASGRGLRLTPSPVKEAAARLGIEVLQPEKPSEIAGRLLALEADLSVVVAYGKLLKPEVLATARHGFMNVHFSLLPKYRGAAPIAWALRRGEAKTGVTLFWLDEGMDTGPVQAALEAAVGPEEDAAELTRRLIGLGVQALSGALADVAAGRIRRQPQEGKPSLAPKLSPEQARANLSGPAVDLHNLVRGSVLGPRAYMEMKGGKKVQILKSALDDGTASGDPGRIVSVDRARGVLIQCDPGRLWFLHVQPEGKNQIPAADFVNGLRLKPGDLLIPNG